MKTLASYRTEAAKILMLAWPLVLGNLSGVAIQFTDALMVAQLGTIEFAAVGLAGHLASIIFLLCSGIGQAIGVRVAQLCGETGGEAEPLRKVIWQGLWVIAIVTLPLSLTLLLAGQVFEITGQAKNVSAIGAEYLEWFLWAIPLMVMFVGLAGAVTALDRPRMVMGVALLTILVNFVCNYALIFGKFGFPALGTSGAAIASIASAAFQALAIGGVLALEPHLARIQFWRNVDWPDFAQALVMLRLGLPIGLILLVEVAFFSVTAFLAGQYGAEVLAAHQIAIQVVTLTLMIALGMSQATSVRAGYAFGRADFKDAARTGVTGAFAITLIMAMLSAAIVFLASPIVAMFADIRSEAGQLAITFLWIAAAFQIADGLQTVLAGALKGMSDTKIPLILAIVAYWAIGMVAIVAFSSTLELGPFGIWLGMALALAVLSLLLIHRFIRLVRRAPEARQ